MKNKKELKHFNTHIDVLNEIENIEEDIEIFSTMLGKLVYKYDDDFNNYERYKIYLEKLKNIINERKNYISDLELICLKILTKSQEK